MSRITNNVLNLTFALGLAGAAGVACGDDGDTANDTPGDSSDDTASGAGSADTGGRSSTISDSSGGTSGLTDDSGGGPPVGAGGRLVAGAAGTDTAGSAETPEPVQIIGAPFETHPDIAIETLREMDCLECHANPEQYPTARLLLMGGTVYGSDGLPAEGVLVSAVTDRAQLLATTGANGLFQIPDDGTVDFDWESAEVTLVAGDAVVEKSSEATGSCNSCHVGALKLEVPQ